MRVHWLDQPPPAPRGWLDEWLAARLYPDVYHVAPLQLADGRRVQLSVDPRDPAEWAEALRTLLSDEALRNSLVERGRARAEEMTWERAARATLGVYREVLGR